MNILRSALFLLVACFLWSATASAAATIVAQQPCNANTNEFCSYVTSNTQFPMILSSLTFNAPSAGRAEVSFHGTMYCANESTRSAVVDLVTQILTKPATPVINGPGGARYATRLAAVENPGDSTTFNLASTRGVAVNAAGTQIFAFGVTQQQIDSQTICYFYNLSFGVVFIP